MKRLLTVVLFAVLLLVPFGVYAREFGHYIDKELTNSTDNGNETTTYEYAINLYSETGENVNAFDFTITISSHNWSANFTPAASLAFNSEPISDVNDEETVYLYSLVTNGSDIRIYGGEDTFLGTYTITLPNNENPDEVLALEIAGGAGSSVYMDENNYNLTVSDVNDIGEYTIELLVGSLVFDFNENFDGTFTWEAQGDTGIKINNLSNKAIGVALDFNSNVEGLMYTGSAMKRLSNGICADYYTQYFEIGQDRSEHPLDWKSDVYTEPGLLDLVYYTDAECTEPLEYGSVYAENVNYYVISNYSPAIVSNGTLLHDLITIDAYIQSIYVPGLDIGVRLSGGTLEDVQRVQRGNKKIGTITVTIVGV